MNKELEALERIKEFYPQWRLSNRQDFNLIETALKRLEELEKAFVSLSKEDEKTKKLLSLEIEKTRTLEIIIKKGIDLHELLLHIKRFRSPEGYNAMVNEKKRITQREFDILRKEIFKTKKEIL